MHKLILFFVCYRSSVVWRPKIILEYALMSNLPQVFTKLSICANELRTRSHDQRMVHTPRWPARLLLGLLGLSAGEYVEEEEEEEDLFVYSMIL